MARRKPPYVPDVVLDRLLAGADPRAALEPNNLPDGLRAALAERVLNAGMDHHPVGEFGNSRNGHGANTVLTDTGPLRAALVGVAELVMDDVQVPGVTRTRGHASCLAPHHHPAPPRPPAAQGQTFLAIQPPDDVAIQLGHWRTHPGLLQPCHDLLYHEPLLGAINATTMRDA